MSQVAKLHDHLRANGIAVIGVSIGRKDDKSTWRIDLEDESQRKQAEALISAFDPVASVPTPTKKDLLEQRLGISLRELKDELGKLAS